MGVKNKRVSGIELLKIIAIVMMVMSHSVPNASSIYHYKGIIDIDAATDSVQIIIILIMRYLGQVGNVIFVAASAWFLIDSNKINPQKIISILLDAFIISISYLVVFLAVGYKLPVRTIIQQILPTTYGYNWFVGCYLMFYAVHPLLNIILNNISSRMLLSVNIILFCLYCCIGMVMTGAYYFNNLVGFICIYFFVAYMKKYMKNTSESLRINIIGLFVGVVGLLAMILGTEILGSKVSYFSHCMRIWCKFMNPFIVLIALTSFNISRSKIFYNRGINYISSLSLLIYLIHSNMLQIHILRMEYFQYMYNTYTYNYILVWCLVYSVLMLVGSMLLSVIYKQTIQRFTAYVAGISYNKLSHLGSKVVDKIAKID